MEIKQEHILFFAFSILAIILLWEIKQKLPVAAPVTPPVDNSNNGEIASIIPTPTNTGEAPEYLTYNQPYAFSPMVGGLLPETTSGQIGQVETWH